MLSSLVHAMSFSNFVNSIFVFHLHCPQRLPYNYHIAHGPGSVVPDYFVWCAIHNSNVLNEYALFVCAFVKCFVVLCTCMSQLLKQHFVT